MADSARPPFRGAGASLPYRPALHIEVQRQVTGAVLVAVRGPIDATAASAMESELINAALTGRTQPPCLLLDLSGVTFLDHAGLDALLHFQDRVATASGTVELLAQSPAVVRLLHEAELDGESWMASCTEPSEAP